VFCSSVYGGGSLGLSVQKGGRRMERTFESKSLFDFLLLFRCNKICAKMILLVRMAGVKENVPISLVELPV